MGSRWPAPATPENLTPPQRLLVGHLAGLSWGRPPRGAATWRAVRVRGLAEIVGEAPPTTVLTEEGQRLAALLNLRKAVNRG